MTSLLERGAPPRADRERPRGARGPQRGRRPNRWRPLFVPVARATGLDVLLPLVAVEVVVLIAWTADSRSSTAASQAIRVGASIWLSALHTRIHVGAAVIGLPPLGLTLACAALVARSAAGVARDRGDRYPDGMPAPRELARIATVFGACYGLLAAVIAALADTSTLHPSPLTALLGGFAVGGAGATWGVLRARTKAGHRPFREALPPPALTALSAGWSALAALAAMAVVLPAALLIAHHRTFSALTSTLGPGSVGTVALLLLEVFASPVLVAGSFAWLTGPGFAIGSGTSVTPWHSHLGPVPALPMLAALPDGGGSGLGWLALAPAVLCGVLAGALILRRHDAVEWWQPFALVAATAAGCGLVAGLASYAAGGPGGAGRLAAVGASGWQVGLALAAELIVGGWLAALAHLAWQTRDVTGSGLLAGSHAAGERLRSAGGHAGSGLRAAGGRAGAGVRAAGGRTGSGLRSAAGRLTRHKPDA